MGSYWHVFNLSHSAVDWFTKAVSLDVYVIMHVKDLSLSVVRVGHRVPLAGICLSLYDLHALNRDVNMIQINKQTNKQTKTIPKMIILEPVL